MNMYEDCVAALGIVMDFTDAGKTKGPPGVFDSVFREAGKMSGPEWREIELTAHFGASRLPAFSDAQRRDHLAKASELARRLETPSDKLEAVDLAAETLMALGEHQRAIGWCNRAAELTQRNAKAAGGRLWRAGRCYVRAGFREEAKTPLRAAIGILREKPGHPLLPHALMDLGGASLDSDPAGAETCYLEAAEIFTGAGHANQAATAWINLGLICSRGGRQDEALDWYEKVRAAREADPAATVAQKGNIHNNIASVWRRKGDFERARAEAERAIEILTPAGGPTLANAIGTMGEILRDEGRPQDALDWLWRAREMFERQPSPNRDQLVVKLENEAGVLEQLGRTDEAAKARARIAELKGVEAPAAPPLPDSKARAATADGAEGAVIVTLDGRNLPDAVYQAHDLATLEIRLETLLEQEGSGELDGHEHGPETTRLFLYGPDARALFDIIAPVLRDYPLCQGARVELRQGEKVEEFGL
jgi:tetratricopeptide (TPR) repeat protein